MHGNKQCQIKHEEIMLIIKATLRIKNSFSLHYLVTVLVATSPEHLMYLHLNNNFADQLFAQIAQNLFSFPI